MSVEKPLVVPDVHDPGEDDLIIPGPIHEEGHDNPHQESRSSQALHERRSETSPPVQAANLPL